MNLLPERLWKIYGEFCLKKKEMKNIVKIKHFNASTVVTLLNEKNQTSCQEQRRYHQYY